MGFGPIKYGAIFEPTANMNCKMYFSVKEAIKIMEFFLLIIQKATHAFPHVSAMLV
jgi:hypothetical protein